MVVRLPDVWRESVMLGGWCGAESAASGASTGGGLRLELQFATGCPKCRHCFEVRARAPAVVCCAATRALHALTGGGLVKPPAPTSAPASPPPSAPAAVVTWSWLPMRTLSPDPPEPDGPDSLTEADVRRLAATARALEISGWYYRDIGWQESQRLLAEAAPGTFLIRDSAAAACAFALSVQTERGPTSVRLRRRGGRFRLDSEPRVAASVPAFECAVALVEFYLSHGRSPAAARHAWVDSTGEARAAARLRLPLRKAVPSLMHLARSAVHAALKANPEPRLPALPPPHAKLPLPQTLKDYLAEYPYSC